MRIYTYQITAISARLYKKLINRKGRRYEWLTAKYSKAFAAYNYVRGDQRHVTTGQLINLWE